MSNFWTGTKCLLRSTLYGGGGHEIKGSLYTINYLFPIYLLGLFKSVGGKTNRVFCGLDDTALFVVYKTKILELNISYPQNHRNDSLHSIWIRRRIEKSYFKMGRSALELLPKIRIALILHALPAKVNFLKLWQVDHSLLWGFFKFIAIKEPNSGNFRKIFSPNNCSEKIYA